MKRFFKPIEKETSNKRPAVAGGDGSGTFPLSGGESAPGDGKKEPLKFLTWNANSFLLRIKNNWPEFTKFVITVYPDVIAIQEVRMPAAGTKGGPKCHGELKDDTNSSRDEKQVL